MRRQNSVSPRLRLRTGTTNAKTVMNNMSLRKAVLATLESWEKLDDAHKGPGYNESVARLVSWADELENGKNKSQAAD